MNANNPQFRFSYRYAQGTGARIFVSTVTVNDDSGAVISPSINQLIKSSVTESIGALTDNFSQVIEDRLGGFLRRIVPLSSKPLKRRVERVTSVRERETNSSLTIPLKCWTDLTRHPTL